MGLRGERGVAKKVYRKREKEEENLREKSTMSKTN